MRQQQKIDRIDAKILSVLSRDGRISWRDLAEQVGLSLTPTIRRVRHLETIGLIKGYASILDEGKLAGPMSVFAWITLEKQTEGVLATFEEEIAKIPQVMSCFLMTGDADYLLRVAVHDLEEYQALLIGRLTRIPGLAHIKSSFALKPVIQKLSPTVSATAAPRSAARKAARGRKG